MEVSEDIYTSAKRNFAGLIYKHYDPELTLTEHFKQYDHYEVFNREKYYDNKKFLAVHNSLLKFYQNYFFILAKDNQEEYYVVWIDVPNDLEKLEPYCNCIGCRSSFFNPLKYIWCPYCNGCIKAGKGFAKEKYIQLAERRMQNPNPDHLNLKGVVLLLSVTIGFGTFYYFS